MNFALIFVLTAALVVNGLPSAQNPVPIASPDDLDDMEYEQDNDGDSHVPPIVVKRLNEAGEPIPLVQIPDKSGEFQVMSRMDVQEYRKNASSFEAAKYVRFFLYRANMTGVRYEFSLDGVETLVGVGFRLDLPTAILVHGWLGSSESEVIGPLAKALLEQDNKNVIAVDWEKGASTLLYPVARYRVPKVADIVAALIDNLVSGYGLDINRVGIIGHSLGAHIAGITAQRVRSGKIAYIVGLDPASPLFRVKKPDERLSPDDAKYVEIIHTNGKALGFYTNIGQADFYPNGGVSQPGCGISFTCSHSRAVDFFKESLKNRNYYAGRCDDLTNLGPNCSTSRTAIGGLVWRSTKPSGVYYMSTASIAPFLRSGALMGRGPTLWLMVFVPLVVLMRW